MSTTDRKAFVISPIGKEGSPTRKRAEVVFEFVIAPAMEKCGFTASLSHDINRPGRISEQMIEAILEWDLCIADLTDQNANVFYELAVAHAAARPVVILLQQGEEPPFDVSDHRCVFYDLNEHIELYRGVYADKLVKAVRELESDNWEVDVPFGDDLEPLGGRNRELLSPGEMDPTRFFAAIGKIKEACDGTTVERRFRPDVVVGVNPGGAIVAGILYFLFERGPQFVPLSFRAGIDEADQENILRAIVKKLRAQAGTLRILVVDAVFKTGESLRRARELLEKVLRDEGWIPEGKGAPGDRPNSRAIGKYEVRTAVLGYRPPSGALEKGEAREEPDFVVDREVERFPYGRV